MNSFRLHKVDCPRFGGRPRFGGPRFGAFPEVDCPQFDGTFGQRLKALQYRYDLDGRKMGGVRILSGVNRKVKPLDIFGELQSGH